MSNEIRYPPESTDFTGPTREGHKPPDMMEVILEQLIYSGKPFLTSTVLYKGKSYELSLKSLAAANPTPGQGESFEAVCREIVDIGGAKEYEAIISELVAAQAHREAQILREFALEVREGVSTESCDKHSRDSHSMLHHQQVYDELNWALEKRGLPNTEPALNGAERADK